MIALNSNRSTIMAPVCDAVLNAFYIILSATIIFAQLVVLVPSLMTQFPFYKRANYALDKLFRLDEEDEFAYPPESEFIPPEMVKLRVGYIQKGERGFRELLGAVKEYRPMPDIEVKTLGLAYGDIPIPTSMVTPNFALFAKEIGIEKPIYFNPFGYDVPSYIKAIFLDWVIRRTQTQIAKYTAIMVVIWIVIVTFIIFG